MIPLHDKWNWNCRANTLENGKPKWKVPLYPLFFFCILCVCYMVCLCASMCTAVCSIFLHTYYIDWSTKTFFSLQTEIVLYCKQFLCVLFLPAFFTRWKVNGKQKHNKCYRASKPYRHTHTKTDEIIIKQDSESKRKRETLTSVDILVKSVFMYKCGKCFYIQRVRATCARIFPKQNTGISTSFFCLTHFLFVCFSFLMCVHELCLFASSYLFGSSFSCVHLFASSIFSFGENLLFGLLFGIKFIWIALLNISTILLDEPKITQKAQSQIITNWAHSVISLKTMRSPQSFEDKKLPVKHLWIDSMNNSICSCHSQF